MPPVSGALAWVQGLLRRLDEPYKSLGTVLKLMEDTDEVEDSATRAGHAAPPVHPARRAPLRPLATVRARHR